MNYKERVSSFYLFILLFGLLLLPSCTFDYFEDETNYVVYVPKADRNHRADNFQIEDLRILIYGGQLEQERHFLSPFNNNPRSRVGNFNFHLYPGWHSVYCFANTSELEFSNLGSYDNAMFSLSQSVDGYKEPSNILLCTEYRNPNIKFPTLEVIDTVHFDRKYVAKICIAFKNLRRLNSQLNYNNISNINIEAEEVGVYQKLALFTDSINTRSSRYNEHDKMRLIATKDTNFYENPYSGYEFGIHNYYLPSLEEDTIRNKPIRLTLDFINNNNKVMYTLFIELIENGEPTILHTNQTIYIGVDGNKSFTLPLRSPQDWDINIQPGGNSGPGGGGLEM